MPGRVSNRTSSARPSTTSHLSHKSSIPTLNSRASTASRISSPVVSVTDEGPSSHLRNQICAIFADSQRSTAGHRKLVVRLRKLQEECCYEPEQPISKKRGGKDAITEHFGEEVFNAEVGRCVLRVLCVKKTEGAGDRVVRLLGLFLKGASDKDLAIIAADNADETQTFPETPTSRLTFSILSLLLPLLTAKEKTVRFRSTQIASHIVNSLDSIDDELYHLIRQGLLKRIRDKEPTIRIQAVLGLGRLAGNEAEEDPDNEDGDNDDAGGLLEKLLEVLQNDTSAEVRRSLLLNLPLTPGTLPYLLERARDLDPATRRALYSRLLPTLGDFRHLSLSMREKLLRWGLRDRDENVRKAAGRLFRERWIEDCAGTRTEGENGAPIVGQLKPPSIPGLLELLERIDVVNSGTDNGIALEAMKDFWSGRPNYRDAVIFDDAFWDSLTAETVFLARSFDDFCRTEGEGKYEVLIEEKMPEVTKLGFFLRKYANALLGEGEGNEEETMVEQEFIVEQLLHIAMGMDYSDEAGRRKMFGLLREMLGEADLPDEVTKLTVEVLRRVCGADAAGEREFCGVVLEAVAEVHDNIVAEEDESFVSAKSEISDENAAPSKSKKQKRAKSGTPATEGGSSQAGSDQDDEKAIKEIMINLKCLHIAQCMLQNVEGNLQQNIHLVTMLNNLVVPAVRSHEAPIRERGLVCLGLCCLLDKTLAEENLTLFIHCFNKGHEALQITALQILSDILTTHPSLLSTTTTADTTSETIQVPPYQKPHLKSFARALKPTTPPPVQAAGATTLSKLLLTSILTDTDLLRSLVLAFFDPRTQSNAALRQSLAYFLPVYCHSRHANCARMGTVAVGVVKCVMAAAEEFWELEAEGDSDGSLVGGDGGESEKRVRALMGTVVGMLVEWTDGRKVVKLDDSHHSNAAGQEDGLGNVHLDIATDVLERVLGVTTATACPREEKKVLLGMLGKVWVGVPGQVGIGGVGKANRVKELLDEAMGEGVAADAAGRNALVKLKNCVLKVLAAGGSKAQFAGKSSGEEDGVTVVAEDEVDIGGDDGRTDVVDDDDDDNDEGRIEVVEGEEETKPAAADEDVDEEVEDDELL